ncbi:MAG: trigger factor [Coprococcus sp.]
MMKRALKLGTLCLGMAILLCACGNSSKGESEAASETGEGVVQSESETEDTTVYAYDYDVESMVTLGDYKGLTYTMMDTLVTDDEIDAEIDIVLSSSAVREQITDRAVEDGDTVNLDYEGLLDGVAFDGGTAQGASLMIGSDSYIDGFEDGLIGVLPGEETSLHLTFPDPYKNNPDLAGKEVVFNVTVNYIEGEDIIPGLDDTFVQNLNIDDVKTVEEYREYISSQLKDSKEYEAENNRQKELFQKAVENAEVKEYPEELVEQYRQEYISYYQQYAAYFGMEMADFLTQYMDQTEEEFNQDAAAYGQEVAGNMLIVCAIARAEGIDVTDELYAQKISEYAEQSGYADAATLEADYGRNYLKQLIINEEVIKLLEESAEGVSAAETEETEKLTAE